MQAPGQSGKLWCRARSGSQGSREGSGEGLGGCSEEGLHGRLWHRARSGSTDPEAVVQSQVRFKRVPEKVPEKGPGSLGAKPSQVQPVPEKVAEAKPGQVHLIHGNLAEVFPALGFAARFRKICKNEMLRLLGIPPKLIVFCFFPLEPCWNF